MVYSLQVVPFTETTQPLLLKDQNRIVKCCEVLSVWKQKDALEHTGTQARAHACNSLNHNYFFLGSCNRIGGQLYAITVKGIIA